MTRRWYLAAVCGAVLVLCGCNRDGCRSSGGNQLAQQPSASDPDIGFDYRAFIRDHLALVGAGKADEAAAFLPAHAIGPNTFTAAGVDDARNKFQTIATT